MYPKNENHIICYRILLFVFVCDGLLVIDHGTLIKYHVINKDYLADNLNLMVFLKFIYVFVHIYN